MWYVIQSLISAEIEKQIEKDKLTFLQVHNDEIEWNIRLPMFVDTFNKIVQENNRIPSQDEFVEKYFEFNSTNLERVNSDPNLKIGLEARLRRTYPSFVRDIHLKILFKEKGLSSSYDRDTDVVGGVDHLLNYKGTKFCVHSYVGTSRGRFGRRIKNKRHSFDGFHLDIILNLNDKGTKKIGDFFLYSDNEIDNLISEMNKIVSTNNQKNS